MSSKIVAFALLFIFSAAISVTGHQFQVGGQTGWAPPDGDETETYNEWAEQHRFHIGDILYFKYQNDSVLVVAKEDYETCNVTSPIERFEQGGAMFKFDRHGYFYFISGEQGNCELGQKLIIRVMVQNVYHPNFQAPAPSPGGSGGGDGGWNPGVAFNSTSMISVTSYLMTTITGVFLILYLFMH
ncbi:hypothetical protein V2J09_020503 [Rumex salicifolius]